MITRLTLLLAATLSSASAPVREPPSAVQVIDAINLARADPPGYAIDLRGLRARFKGNIYRDRDVPNGLITNEGPAAFDDAANYLSARSSVPAVMPSDLLNAAAMAHVLEQGPRGTTGHASADGSGPGARLKRLGGDQYVAEMITYGGPTAEAVVRQLAVDDGVRDRGHRHILFSIEYRYAGAACGTHKTFGTMCVVEFSRTPNGAP